MIAEIMQDTADSIRQCRGLVLLGKDGFVVEKVGENLEDDVENLVVELLGILKKLDKLVAGEAESLAENSLIIEGNTINYYLNPLIGGYFIFMITGKAEFTGKCRYALRRAAGRLNKELR